MERAAVGETEKKRREREQRAEGREECREGEEKRSMWMKMRRK